MVWLPTNNLVETRNPENAQMYDEVGYMLSLKKENTETG